jgi:hypothetical protein
MQTNYAGGTWSSNKNTEELNYWYTISNDTVTGAGVNNTRYRIVDSFLAWGSNVGQVKRFLRIGTIGQVSLAGLLASTLTFTPTLAVQQHATMICDIHQATATSGTCYVECTLDSPLGQQNSWGTVNCSPNAGLKFETSSQWTTVLGRVNGRKFQFELGR